MNIKDVITELCGLPGPAGFEERVAAGVKDLLEPFVDETWIDVLGNVIGVRRCGKENAQKLLFDAHIDEIGFIVTGVEEGFLRFACLGGFDARVIPAASVMVLTEPPLYGVIPVLPPHVLEEKDTEKNFKIEDMFIDVGLTQEEAARLIAPGTPGVFAYGVREFGDNGLCGKALDDRAGFVAILRTLELLKKTELDVDLYVMASVQEEVGVRGATTGTYAVAPDYAVVVDVDHAKTPDAKPTEANTMLGGGAIITHGPNMNPALTEMILKLAKENEIKHQISVIPGGSGTNARAIQISREGVATALLGLPMKYMHSANEVISLDDVEYIAQLLCKTAQAIKGE
ncbi:MAG: M20/M25/M40 family metallo-hydrolase [Oscillospiraceae bacterium]|jgi:endoglucanase|nr:M20/M25/M40 family metallo-hydrolase [Oscillospiraceae bacterium]